MFNIYIYRFVFSGSPTSTCLLGKLAYISSQNVFKPKEPSYSLSFMSVYFLVEYYLRNKMFNMCGVIKLKELICPHQYYVKQWTPVCMETNHLIVIFDSVDFYSRIILKFTTNKTINLMLVCYLCIKQT